MKKIFYLSLLFFTGIVYSQNTLYEAQYLSDSASYESFIDHSGYLVSIGTTSNTLTILKTNVDDGSIVSSESIAYSGAESLFIEESVVLSNGDYGILFSQLIGENEKPTVLRYSPLGNVVWSKSYYTAQSGRYQMIKEDNSGNLFIGGYSIEPNTYLSPLLLSLDANGTLIWGRKYSNMYYGFEDFEILADGSFVLVGYNNTQSWICEISNTGVQQSFKNFTLNGAIRIKFIDKTQDGYIVAGDQAGEGTNGSFDYFIAELDNALNVTSQKAFGGLFREELKYFKPYLEGSYLLAGISASVNTFNFRPVLMRVARTGDIIWTKSLGGDLEDDGPGGLNVLDNGDIIININDRSDPISGFKMYRTNQFGEFNCIENSIEMLEADFPIIETPGATGPEIIVSGEENSVYSMGNYTASLQFNCALSNPETTKFHKVLVAPDLEMVQGITETYDGGYVLVGHANNGIHGNSDILALRIDDVGDTLWSTYIGTNAFDSGVDVMRSFDGGFIVLNRKNCELIKLSDQGELMYSKEFYSSEAYKMVRSTIDNSIYISTISGVLKVSNDFNLIWGQSYTTDVHRYKDIDIASNGDLILTGEISTGGNSEGVIQRIDADGNLLWSQSVTSATSGIDLLSITELDAGDLIVGGMAIEGGDTYPVLASFSGGGTLNWIQKYPNSIDGGFFDVTSKGDKIYTAGFLYVTVSETEPGNSILSEIDPATGTVNWTKAYGENFDNSRLFVVEKTNDDGFILGGFHSGFGNGGADFSIIKTDSLGNSSGCHEHDRTVVPLPYPVTVAANAITINTIGIENNTSNGEGDWITLYRDMALQLNYSKQDVSCFGFENGNIEVMASNGIAPYSYTWGDGSSSNSIADLSAGTYEITIEDAVGCVVMESIEIIEPLPLISSFVHQIPSCHSTGDGEIEINTTGGTQPYNYQWNNGQTDSVAVALFAGNYNVNVFDANGCLSSNATQLTSPEVIAISFNIQEATCGSDDGAIEAMATGGTGSFSYNWNNGPNTAIFSNVSSGTYQVFAEDVNGCIDSASVELGTQVTPVDICMITVDSTSNKNIVVWEKDAADNVDGYYIYRNVLGAYQNIGFVDNADLSEFVDNSFGINPNVTSYRYKISKLDTCGNESDISEYHETMHLTTNQGTGNDINLIWDEYEGFPFVSYRIMKDTTNNGIYDYFEIDAVGSGTFTWTDSDPGSYASYSVYVDPGTLCSSTKANDYNSSRSNRSTGIAVGGGDVGISEYLEEDVVIYPNPNNGNFVLRNSQQQNLDFRIIDARGKLIADFASQESTVQFDLALDKGMYFVTLSSGNHLVTKRMVVQ